MERHDGGEERTPTLGDRDPPGRNQPPVAYPFDEQLQVLGGITRSDEVGVQRLWMMFGRRRPGRHQRLGQQLPAEQAVELTRPPLGDEPVTAHPVQVERIEEPAE